MLKIDEKYIVKEVISPVLLICQNVCMDFEETANKLQPNDRNEVFAAFNHLVLKVIDTAYKKGFQDGMRYALNAASGKEVIEIKIKWFPDQQNARNTQNKAL